MTDLGVKTPQRTAWTSLYRPLGVIDTALLTVVAVALTDIEAGAVAAIFAVGLGMSRWRTGLIGRIILAGSFANLTFWTSPAAVSNIAHHEGIWMKLVPSLAAITSVIGMVATTCHMLERWRGWPSVPSWTTPAVVALTAAAVIGALLPIGTATVVGPGDIVVTAENTAFTPTTLRAESGEFGVVMENRDLFWHTFTIAELGTNLTVPVGATRRVTIEATPGTYEFVCAIPGHTQAGMKGTITID